MLRLAYAPRAFVFIRSTTMGGRIYDVSADITRGSVTQNVGDVSTLEFSLRNRFKKWLRDHGDGSAANPGTGKLLFTPMDLVTCWLQRLPGNPIQQFTGYLDSVPYYQGYPGDAPFTATCTLKKMAYTWFDPGLQMFQTWLLANGWRYDPTSGQAVNPTLNYTTVATENGIEGTNLNDGGFGDLVSRFMTDVANWNPDDVLVSDLPPQLPKAAASLYQKVARQSETDLENLSQFFGAAMGISVTNGADPNSSAKQRNMDVLQQMQDAADSYNIPVTILAFAAYMMTQFTPNKAVPQGSSSDWGYGIYLLQPNNNPLNNTPPGVIPSPVAPPTVTTPVLKIGSRTFTVDQLQNVSSASNALCLLLNNNIGSWVNGARAGDVNAIQAWLQHAFGRPLPNVDPVQAYNVAVQFVGAGIAPVPTQNSMPVVDPSSFSWSQALTQNTTFYKILTPQDRNVIKTYYSNNKPWLAALLYRIKYLDKDLRLAPPSTGVQLLQDQLLVTGSTSDLQRAFNALAPDPTIDSLTVFYTGSTPWTGSATVTNIAGNSSSLPTTLAHLPYNALLITQRAAPPAQSAAPVLADVHLGSQTVSVNGQQQAVATVPWQDIAAFTGTSAFAANFSFPADIIEANLLTGQKALMNDMSCLDAIEQLCAASMRTFRCLPDGRFLAFYPDYFGAYRGPYWDIDNIELINFGIVLNDEQLATHVFVVGDTVDFNNQVDLIEQIATTGVATIVQADMLHSFIQPWDPNNTTGQGELGAASTLLSSWDFLQHYGARPYKEDQPIIRNSTFEFLFAWQRFMQKWAQQFQTTVEMTFQPEIMAGGIVRFNDHNVQMFVESVTHSWDYSSGFNTSAVLTAPSIPVGTDATDRSKLPGFALAGNPVGIGAS